MRGYHHISILQNCKGGQDRYVTFFCTSEWKLMGKGILYGITEYEKEMSRQVVCSENQELSQFDVHNFSDEEHSILCEKMWPRE